MTKITLKVGDSVVVNAGVLDIDQGFDIVRQSMSIRACLGLRLV